MATPVREVLLSSNDEFRRLAQEHQHYSTQLDTILNKPYHSEQDQLEEIRLKKLKLRLKDEMEYLEQTFRRTHPENAA
jgi:hypothetical protein